MKIKAFSIAELIIAVFLLSYVFLVVVTLFHTALRYGGESQRVTSAGVFADSLMSEIRAWASVPANFDSDWSTYTGSVTHPEFPGLRAEVTVVRDPADTNTQRRWLFSPCKTAELYYAADQQRVLRNSCVWIQITVPIGGATQDIELVSLVGEPYRELNPTVSVNRTGGAADPVPFGQSVDFEATLSDPSFTVEDPLWVWGIVPQRTAAVEPGNATVREVTRDGRQSGLTNQVIKHPNPSDPNHLRSVPGGVSIEAFTRYQGRGYVGDAWSEMGP